MNRRNFLQTATAGLSGVAAPALLTGQSNRHPNVVFILVDQWRAQAFGYTGDPNAHTPAIDALAAESISFRNAVSGFPVCSPYRASLMTGQYAVNNGVVVNDRPLEPNGPTLGESFRKAGYETAYIGKWHIYGSPDGKFGRRLAPVPKESRFGFEYWKGCECTHNYNRSLYYEGDDTTPKYWKGYDAIAQTADACEFIRSRPARGGATQRDPYFLLLSLGPPHDPYGTAPEHYKSQYTGKTIQLRPNVPEAQKERAIKDLSGYYSHIAALDDCVRQIKDAIDQAGTAEDTVLIFASDHGDMLQSQGLPLKQFPWDESIRVPFLVRHPRIFGRRKRELITPIDAPDIMPTLLGLANLKVPESVDGTDYTPMMKGGKREEAEPAALLNLPASFSVIRRHGIREYRGVRTPQYTFVRSIHGPWLLYDNAADPYQKQNLVGRAQYRTLQARLERMLDAKLKGVRDDFLPGDRYVERAKAAHYREVTVEPGHVKSPWGDWESNWT
jgi:arylsulfatase A-like enzyme